MKKHLIAAAVAASVAVPAMAQVTISGVIDYAVVSDRATGVMNTTGVADSMRSTSLIAFRGSEDLGGGLKAGFVLISDFGRGSLTGRQGSMGTSLGTDAAPSNVDRFFSREAMLTLEGGFGIVHLGRTRNVVDEQHNAHAQGFNTNLNRTGGAGTARADNTVRYVSPAFSGARFHLSQTFGEVNTLGSRSGSGNVQTMGVTFSQGPISAHVAQAKGKAAALENDTTFQTIGGSYNFGFANVALNLNDSETNKAGSAGTEGQSLTVGIPFGGAYRVVLGSHNYKSKAASTDKSTVRTLGLDYALSKRTSAYLAYTNTDTKGASVLAGNNNTAPTAGGDSTRYGVGLAHSF